MTKKNWEDLTQAEKIEDLRADVKQLFSIVSGLASDIRETWEHVRRLERKES